MAIMSDDSYSCRWSQHNGLDDKATKLRFTHYNYFQGLEGAIANADNNSRIIFGRSYLIYMK